MSSTPYSPPTLFCNLCPSFNDFINLPNGTGTFFLEIRENLLIRCSKPKLNKLKASVPLQYLYLTRYNSIA